MLVYKEFSNKSESVVFSAKQIEEERDAKVKAQREADAKHAEEMKAQGFGEIQYSEVFAAI